MNNFRYSGNIPKEANLFNASALGGIEYALKNIIRSDSYNESYTERIGKGILTPEDIQGMGKIFSSLLEKESLSSFCPICTLTLHKHQLIPVIIAFIKHLQMSGFFYKGQSKELNKASNKVTLLLNLIKGLDPSLKLYAMADAYIRAIWAYYFENYQIYE